MTPEPDPDPIPDISIRIDAGDWRSLGFDAHAAAVTAAKAALGDGAAPRGPLELSILLTDDTAIAELNATWRGKRGPTNVLSFPGDRVPMPDGAPLLLGDVVVSFETLCAEADAAGKTAADHLRHLVVHGVLHLLGYDHESDGDAQMMESREVEILADIGVSDPYAGLVPEPDGGAS